MTPAPETVVLVHGLWMHGAAMELMRRRIARCGYRTLAYSYPTVRSTLSENAARLARYCRGLGVTRLHLVGHSLGGALVLRALEEVPPVPVGRIVLAGIPFRGSHAARRFARLPGGRAALGRSMREWLSAERPAPDAKHEIGVIAGSRAFGLGAIFAPGTPRPCDGAVSVAETEVPGMRGHVVLDVSHSGMLVSAAVARQVCAFLRDGAFLPDEGGRMKAAG